MVETVGNNRSIPLKGKELRKTNKPLMEKKRRARINTCLNQLKSLVLQAMNKDSSQYSKLEKADILEMTVNFLKAVPQQKARAASHETVGAIAKYNSGFTECAAEVGRYLGSVQGVDGEVRSRVLNHLSHRMNAIQTSQPTAPPPATHSQPSIQPVYVQIPNTTPVIPGVHTASYPATTPVSTSGPHHQGALVVMPSTVVLPTPVTVQHSWQQQHQQQQLLQQNFVMPLSPPSSRGCSPVSSVSQTPVPVRHSAIQGVQKSSVPTNVDLKSEQLWRPW